ncbi:alpha/beta hydrolase [Gillisia sp. Hel_I_29]|uniref:alpha/beta hydrolase n=1 Tax=Gillisia sp. Hel_I_29 TaxID=1249975 RepID=UPI0005587756|nr:alpha/beta hydrolase-fold protein [Gillisia sp. Hel_I_29]
MKKICALILLCSSSIIFAQEFNTKGKTYIHRLVSEKKYEYEVIVTIPPHYDDSKTYKTLYYLDAWWLEDIVKGNYTLLNRSKTVEDIVLVGISIDGSIDDFTKQRIRDYTPTPYNLNFPFILPLESGALIVDSTNSGNADNFKFFLKDKLFPFVSKKYAIDKKNRGFIGHSLGGLFGINDAMDKKPLFNKHIIISPALWYNKSIKLYEKIENDFKTSKTRANIFMCYGGSEGWSIVNSTDHLLEYFKLNKFDNLEYNFQIYEKEDHMSLLPKSIYDGIEFFYKK